MLTKDFHKKLTELEYDFVTYETSSGTYIDIYDPNNIDYPDEEIATVCVSRAYVFNTNTYLFEQMDEEDQKELFRELVAYSRTPVDERIDKNQKYTYKHKCLKMKDGSDAYLGVSVLAAALYSTLTGENKDTKECKASFTDEDIERYSRKLKIDLTKYVKEEVEDEDL